MESKKNIGNYFKENLEQLDYSPSNKVWDGIEVELKEKKKRRFFFWLFFAFIAIGTISTITYFHDFDAKKPYTNSVVTTGVTNTNENDSKSKKTYSNDRISDSENSNKSDLNNSSSNSTNSNTNNSKNSNSQKNNGISETELVNSENNKSGKKGLNSGVNSSSKKNLKTTSAKKSKAKKSSKITVLENDKNQIKNSKSKKYNYKKGSKANQSEASQIAENNKVGKNSKRKKKSNASGKATTSSKANESIISEDLNSNLNESNSKTDLDALKTVENKPEVLSVKDRKQILEELKKSNQKKRDSIIAVKQAEKEKKGLTENPKNEEEKDTTTTKVTEEKHEIIVAPYFGMNYTGNFGNGNFLNESKTSKKESEFNISYGVLIRIMESKKVGLQLGVGIINSLYSADFTKESNSFISPNNVSLNVSLEELNDLFPNQTKLTSRQETTFIEVPIEAYYILSDKKIGMATTFGISFLKLQKNELFLESDTVDRISIGKLENIAPFSILINVKFNLFYKITSKLNFDLYPSFQYQFMGYKDVSNYHPYFFSIKTGLSYKL